MSDLLDRVYPISKAASQLAKLLKIAARDGAVVVTQKGYPSGVIISPDQYKRYERAVADLDDLKREQQQLDALGSTKL